jgi:hypothetical protein
MTSWTITPTRAQERKLHRIREHGDWRDIDDLGQAPPDGLSSQGLRDWARHRFVHAMYEAALREFEATATPEQLLAWDLDMTTWCAGSMDCLHRTPPGPPRRGVVRGVVITKSAPVTY